MKRIFLLLLLLTASTARAQMQTPVRPQQGWSLGLAAGGSAFSDFQRTEVRARRIVPGGAVEEQDFATRVGAQTTSRLAADLAFWPSANWGLRLYGAYSPTRFQTVIPRAAAEFTGTPRLSSDTTRLARLRITSLQLQALFRMPTINGHVMPYGFTGAGLVHYSIPRSGDPLPNEVLGQLGYGSRDEFGASFGLGAFLLTRRHGWGLNFELLDQLSRTPIASGPVSVVNSLSFTVGLSWALTGR